MTILNKKSLDRILSGSDRERIKIFSRLSRPITYNVNSPDEVGYIESIRALILKLLHTGDREMVQWVDCFIENSALHDNEIWKLCETAVHQSKFIDEDPYSHERSLFRLAAYLSPFYDNGNIFKKTLAHPNPWIRYDQYNWLNGHSTGLQSQEFRKLRLTKIAIHGKREPDNNLYIYLLAIEQYGDLVEDKIKILEEYVDHASEKISLRAKYSIAHIVSKHELFDYRPNFCTKFLVSYVKEMAKPWAIRFSECS